MTKSAKEQRQKMEVANILDRKFDSYLLEDFNEAIEVLLQWHKEEVERILGEIKEKLGLDEPKGYPLPKDFKKLALDDFARGRAGAFKEVKDLLGSYR